MAQGGLQVSRRGGGQHRWVLSYCLPGRGLNPGGLRECPLGEGTRAGLRAPPQPGLTRDEGQGVVGGDPARGFPPLRLGNRSGGAQACAEVAAGRGCPTWLGAWLPEYPHPSPPHPSPVLAWRKEHAVGVRSLLRVLHTANGSVLLSVLGTLYPEASQFI